MTWHSLPSFRIQPRFQSTRSGLNFFEIILNMNFNSTIVFRNAYIFKQANKYMLKPSMEHETYWGLPYSISVILTYQTVYSIYNPNYFPKLSHPLISTCRYKPYRFRNKWILLIESQCSNSFCAFYTINKTSSHVIFTSVTHVLLDCVFRVIRKLT